MEKFYSERNERKETMGWDVVQIGLRHNLPVDDPFATAKEIAKRMKRNIKIVYHNKYEYDAENNVVREAEGNEMIELGRYEVNESKSYLRMLVDDYQAHQIQKLVGIDKLRQATFASEFADSILRDIESPFGLYDIIIEDGKELDAISIFKENVDLNVHVRERWGMWESAFHPSSPHVEWLRNYRMQIYKRARMFGCNEVIIFSDQGPTEIIYDYVNYPADKLKEYTLSYQYLKDSNWVEKSEREDWKMNAKHIMFSSVFQNKMRLSDDDFVEVIYDDFSDIDIPSL